MSFSNVKLVVPETTQSYGKYSTPAEKQANINMLKSIKSKYFASINTWGAALSIPNGVIISFIASESGGTPVQVSNPSGASKYDVWGVMALSPDAFYDAAVNWGKSVKSVGIPESVKAKINAKIPGLLTQRAGTVATDAYKSKIRSAIQNDQDFNILGGTLVLRWLFERFSSGGTVQFNKGLVAYNAGLYRDFLVADKRLKTPNLTPRDTTSMVNDKAIPLESRSYLLKVLGKDGFIELAYKNGIA